jgi:predicted RNase H-like HicB family nuclease
VGYLDDYPDYVTQGETLQEFEDMLRSLREDIQAFEFSFVHHHGKLKKKPIEDKPFPGILKLENLQPVS